MRYFGDVFATLADVTKQPGAEKLDSISMLPTLTGKHDQQKQHEYLYWEFYEQGGKQAVRAENWKAVRMPMLTGRTELYNLESDLGETTNVAAEHPDIVRRLEQLMDAGPRRRPNWQDQAECTHERRRAESRQNTASTGLIAIVASPRDQFAPVNPYILSK